MTRKYTQIQEINPQWQSAIHHFHHFSCEKKALFYILSTSKHKLTLTSYVIYAQSFSEESIEYYHKSVHICKMQTLEQ